MFIGSADYATSSQSHPNTRNHSRVAWIIDISEKNQLVSAVHRRYSMDLDQPQVRRRIEKQLCVHPAPKVRTNL